MDDGRIVADGDPVDRPGSGRHPRGVRGRSGARPPARRGRMRATSGRGGEIAAAFSMLTRIPVRTPSTGRDRCGGVRAGRCGRRRAGRRRDGRSRRGRPDAGRSPGRRGDGGGQRRLPPRWPRRYDGRPPGRDAAQAEIARKDPAIGSGGVIALIVVLAQVTALASLAVLPGGRARRGRPCLLAAGAVSRALPVVVVLLRGDAISRVGLGAWFAQRVGVLDGASAALTATVVASVAGCSPARSRSGRASRSVPPSASASGSSLCARAGSSTGMSWVRRSNSVSRRSSRLWRSRCR